jgi:hypothetical protein
VPFDAIDLGGETVVNGDGLLLDGKTLPNARFGVPNPELATYNAVAIRRP